MSIPPSRDLGVILFQQHGIVIPYKELTKEIRANVGSGYGQAGHKANTEIAQQIRKLGRVMIKQQCQPNHHSLIRVFLLP